MSNKQKSKGSFLTSTFKKRLDEFLAEPGHRLVKVLGYDEETGYEYNDDDREVRALLNSGQEGHYVVAREGPDGEIQWLHDTRIGSDGERVSKKEAKRAAAIAPEAHTNAAMIRHVGEAYSGVIAITRSELNYAYAELAKARAERDQFWEQIREGQSEDANESIMKLGVTVFQAWQSRDFKAKGQEFCQRVLKRLEGQPEALVQYIAAIMGEELREEANKMMLEAAKTLTEESS